MTTQRGGVVLFLTALLTSFASPVSPTAHVPANHPHHPHQISHAPNLPSIPILPAPDSVWTPVRATIYYPTGRPMFSGESIPAGYDRRHRRYRTLAVSGDLLAQRGYHLQDTVLVQGDPADPYWDGSLNGRYIIKDKMNKRHHGRIDILSRPGHERDIGLWRARIFSLSKRHHDRIR